MCFSVYALTDINNLFLFVLYTGHYRVGQKSALQIFSLIIHRYECTKIYPTQYLLFNNNLKYYNSMLNCLLY